MIITLSINDLNSPTINIHYLSYKTESVCLWSTRNMHHLQGWRLPYIERMEKRILRIGISGFYKNLKTKKAKNNSPWIESNKNVNDLYRGNFKKLKKETREGTRLKLGTLLTITNRRNIVWITILWKSI